MDFRSLQIACTQTIVNISLYIRRSNWLSPTTQPNRLKTYGNRHDLFASRIFLPNGHEGQKLPLVIDAHGGGFMLNNPSADDPMARHLADTVNCAFVSVDYRKAPQNRFPRAYEDIVEQVLAVLDDPELPIDRDRVVLCGSSAGGNLVLGAAQDPRLRGQVKGIVGIYPLCDMVPTGEEKMATRPDPSVPDFLGNTYPSVLEMYLDRHDKPDLKDVRLSPTYLASRKDLPNDVLILGCEHDMLCREAEIIAEKLAFGHKKDVEGGWEAGGVRWYKVNGQTHAFEHFAKNGEEEKERIVARDSMWSVISDWLSEMFGK